MIKYKWYEIIKYKPTIAKVRDKEWNIFEIDIKSYLHGVDKRKFNRRIDYLNEVSETLPKDLPKEIRKYLIFSYIQDF